MIESGAIMGSSLDSKRFVADREHDEAVAEEEWISDEKMKRNHDLYIFNQTCPKRSLTLLHHRLH